MDLSAHNRNETVKLLQYVQNLLIQRDVLTLPICYLRPEIDKSLQSQLKEIIEKNHGTVVEEEENADHIVYAPITENPREIESERESTFCSHQKEGYQYFPSLSVCSIGF
jgi:hypothetical protein